MVLILLSKAGIRHQEFEKCEQFHI